MSYRKVGSFTELLELDKTPRLIQSYIIEYLVYLKQVRNTSWSFRNIQLAAIKHWYRMNDFEELNWFKISKYLGEHNKVVNDRGYKTEEIQQILLKSDERMRVIILLLASTGIRVGAIPCLRLRALTKIPEYNLYQITVYENTEEEYFTFCTPECATAIDSYLAYRERYGEKLKPDTPLIREQFNIYDLDKIHTPKPLASKTIGTFLARMSDKALFHRTGELVVKNEIGGYDSIEEMIKEHDARIEDIQSELSNTNDRITRQGLKAQIKTVEEAKQDLYKDAKKLIDLSHKILVFLDTPRFELFNAIMSLLSHDNYEVEYEFADKSNNGIKTKTNVIRGYPAVIFAQALDFSHYKRYPEIQRRFIITNPKMDKEKYREAIKLIGKKFGLPDFMYQATIVSNSQKEQVREIIRGLRENILNVCDAIDSGRNNVIIPFEEVIIESLQSNKAQDMTVAYRLFSYLSLLPIVNIDKRPRIVFRKKGEPITQVMPFATYDDLGEAMFLMQYASGVRPFILEWYYDVFLKTYNAKTEPDSKIFNTGERIEDRKAVTTEQLVIATKETQNKSFTNKKILESYLEPLMNEGYIDKQESAINHRSNIYYPVVVDSREEAEKSLFDSTEKTQKTNNEQQIARIKVSDFTLNPTSEYIKGKVEQVVSCSSTPDLFCEILDHNENKITVDEFVRMYYQNPSIRFSFRQEQESRADVDTDVKNNNFTDRQVVDEQQNVVKIGDFTREIGQNPYSHEGKTNNEQQEDNVSITLSCNYCTYETYNEAEYDKHSAKKHPNKPGYPDRNGLT